MPRPDKRIFKRASYWEGIEFIALHFIVPEEDALIESACCQLLEALFGTDQTQIELDVAEYRARIRGKELN